MVLKKLRSVFIFLYVYFAGVRFYHTTMTPTTQNIEKVVIKTVKGYTITFSFYREKLNYISYFLGHNKLSAATVYVISANFSEDAPVEIRRYNSVKLLIKDGLQFINDSSVISRLLLNAYLDFLNAKLTGG
jgi:hypothetical protein